MPLRVTLSWTDNATNEIGFRIERATGNGAFAKIGQALANALSYVDTTAISGTQYRYRVIAFNAAGSSSASNIVTITPNAPTFLIVVTPGANGTTSPVPGNVIVNKNANQTITFTPNTGYYVSSVVVDGTSVLGTPASYTFTNVVADHTISVIFSTDSSVYRFRNLKTSGVYFWTANEAEKNSFITNGSATWALEGTAYYAYQTQQAGTFPVYRFRNLKTSGVYFWTANEAEKNSFATNTANWLLEGIAYYAPIQ